MKTKLLAMIMASVMLVVGFVSGTLAWLTDTTGKVENTFTTSGIDIDLTETFNAKSSDEKDDNDIWKKQMVPGYVLDKDPVVTVKANSEKCYLFVKVSKSEDFDNYIAYTPFYDEVDSSGNKVWIKLTDTTITDGDVYYRVVDAVGASDEKKFHLLKAGTFTDDGETYSYAQDQVLVKPSVTNEMMETLKDSNKDLTITFTAYASQYYKDGTTNFDVETAWANVNK